MEWRKEEPLQLISNSTLETNGANNTEKKSNLDTQESDPDPDTVCGIGRFRPRWLQGLATPRTYLVLYSILGTLSGTYYTYRIGVITTLEKRFHFNSKVSGLIMMVDEATPVFLGVPVGYWAAKTHRPRMIGLGMLMVTLCCFVSAVPYLAYGPEPVRSGGVVGGPRNKTELELCDSANAEECEGTLEDRTPTVPVVLLLLLAGLLKGFGNIAYHAIGLAYMDDIAKKKNSPLYLATTFSLRLLGPMIGYLMCSAFLKYYENPFDDPGYGPEDPRWIGGWWMGFLVQGFLLFFFSALIALFPRRLPGQEKREAKDLDGLGLDFDFAGLVAAVKRLFLNPVFVLLVVRTVMTIGTIGQYMMLPKYMEHQFRLTASEASLYAGPPGLAAVMSSFVIGGWLLWRFRPSPKLLTAGMLALEILNAIGPLLLMIPRCDTVQMTHYGFNNNELVLNAECNMGCNCSKSSFTPVCAPDGTAYFSPCHAGCTSQQDGQTFSSCSCLWEVDVSQAGNMTKGLCAAETCWSETLAYIITMPVLQFLTSLLYVAYTMILFRVIHPRDKSIAIGLLETFICLFGFLPFLAGFSAMVDSACLVWEETCGETGNCWFYDVPRFNYLMHGTSAFFGGLSAVCVLALYFLSNRIGDLYREEEDTSAPSKDPPGG